MIRSLLLVAVLVASMTGAPPSGSKIEHKTLESGGRKRSYSLFVPEGLKGPAPLLVLLHGSGRDGRSIVEPWQDLAKKQGVILVGPDAADSAVWAIPTDGPAFIHELVESLKASYPIDPKRVYLFGHSAGAVFALNLTVLESQYFAATAVHAGAWRSPEELKMADYSRRPVPLKIIVGDQDEYFSLEATKTTSDTLKAKGQPVDVTILKGHNHDYYRISAQVNELAWSSLANVSLDGEPHYEDYDTSTK